MERSARFYSSILRWAVVGAGAMACASAAWSPAAHAAGITTTWDGANGDWFDPSHWSPGFVPLNDSLNTYSPIINAGTVTLNNSITTNAFTLGAPATLILGTNVFYALTPTINASIMGQIDLSAGSTLFSRANLTLANATVSGDGILRQSVGSMVISGVATVDNLSLENSVAVSGSGTLTINQSFFWSGATFSPMTVHIASNASLVAVTGITTVGQIINEGIAYLGADTSGHLTGAVYGQSPSSGVGLTNRGIVYADSDLGGSGTISNSGLLTNLATPLGVQRTISPFLYNTGTVSGSFIISTGLSTGVLSPDAGTAAHTLRINSMSLGNGAVLTSAFGGTILANSLIVSGSVTADHLNFSTVSGAGPSTLTLTGVNTWSGFSISATIIKVAADGQFYVPSGGTFSSGGSLVIQGAAYLGVAGSINSGGQVALINATNNGQLYVQSPEVSAGGSLTNNGFVGNLNTPPNTILPTIGSFIVNNGTISGSLSLTGGGINNGVLSGDSPAGPRTLTLASNWILTTGSHITSVTGSVNATGTLSFAGDVYADHLQFNGLSGGPVGTLHLSGPNVAGSGPLGMPVLNVTPTGVLTLPNSLSLNGLLLNEGSVVIPNLQEVISGNGSILNEGLFTTQQNATIGRPFYNNGGTLTAAFGSLTLGAPATTSGLFVASSTQSIISFQGQTLDNATLSGPGLFYGAVTLRDNNLASNAIFITVGGTGNMDISGSLYFGTANLGAQLRVLPGASLALSGTQIINGATVSNLATTSFGVPSTSLLQIGNGEFLNAGSATVSSIMTLTSLTGPNPALFVNSGTLNVTGSLQVDNGITFNNTGTLLVPGTMTLSFGNTFSNSGTIIAAGNGSISIAGSVITGTLIETSTTARFSLTATLNNATLQGTFFVGSVVLAGTSTAQAAAFTGYSGAGALNISQTLALGFQPVAVSNGAHVTLLSGGTVQIPTFGPTPLLTLSAGTFTNAGTFDFSSTNGGTVLSFAAGGVLENQGLLKSAPPFGGGFTFGGDSNPGNLFNNSGTVILTPPFGVTFNVPVLNSGSFTLAGNSRFILPFYSTGSFAAQPVPSFTSINFAGGGSASGLFSTLPATNTPPAGIVFSAPFTFSNATLSGNISNTATLTVNGKVSAAPFTILGNINGPGTLAGSLVWGGGTLSNAGGLQISSPTPGLIGTLTLNGFTSFVGDLTIEQPPPGPFAGKALDGLSLVIPAGNSAVWSPTTSTSMPIDSISFQNGSQIVNNGTFYTYVRTIAFNAGDNSTAAAFINHGVFGRNSATSPVGALPITTFTVPFHNTGLVDIQQGFIDFAGGYFSDGGGTIQFAPGAGLAFSGGSYDFGNSTLDLGSGGLSGTGIVHGDFISAGIISPGHSPGALTVDGDLQLTASSDVAIELAGIMPGSQFDTLTVTGALHLNGVLSLSLLDGFRPDESDTFHFLSATTLDGTFLNTPDGSRFADGGSDGTFLITYSTDAITLTDFQAAVPEPLSLFWLAPALFPLLKRNRRAARAFTR